eukprot:ANDGO_08314.mRNA.1 Glutathione gamma-glutamylcysteinyltransferase
MLSRLRTVVVRPRLLCIRGVSMRLFASSSSSSHETMQRGQAPTTSAVSILTSAEQCPDCGHIPGFYMRSLPAHLTPFPSREGKEMFRESLDAGLADSYFQLSTTFHTQSEPAYCGLATLVIALNALGCDPGKIWKGPWRWYSEEMLLACFPLHDAHIHGIDLDEFCELALWNGASVQKFRPFRRVVEDAGVLGTQATDGGTKSEEQFRQDVVNSVRSPESILVVNFSRKECGQTGEGHFSPIAAYCPSKDAILVLDVARFKHGPWWVPLPLMYRAMIAQDSATQQSRGWAVVQRAEEDVLSSVKNHAAEPLRDIAARFVEHVASIGPHFEAALMNQSHESPLRNQPPVSPVTVTAGVITRFDYYHHQHQQQHQQFTESQGRREHCNSAEKCTALDEKTRIVFRTLFESLPKSLNDALRSFTFRIVMHACTNHRNGMASLLMDVKRTRMFTVIQESIKRSPRWVLAPELASVLLLGLPESVFRTFPPEVRGHVLSSLRSMPPLELLLAEEITSLRAHLLQVCKDVRLCADDCPCAVEPLH